MALNGANGINTKHPLLALSHLAGKTLCPVLLPASSSGLHLLWVPQSGTIFISEAEGSRHPLLFPSRLHPTLHIVGELLRGVRPTSPGLLFLPHLFPSPSSRYSPVLQIFWVFPPPGGNCPLPILPGRISSCVFNWKESSLRIGFLLISASPPPGAGGST